MAYFKINEPNQPTKWIKSIDRANTTLEFSTTRDGCFQQDSGFFADSEYAYLMFHFKENYPEIQYMTIDTDWNPSYDNNMEAMDVQEAPHNPYAIHGEQNDHPRPQNLYGIQIQEMQAQELQNQIVEADCTGCAGPW